jgi:hypothetical protein
MRRNLSDKSPNAKFKCRFSANAHNAHNAFYASLDGFAPSLVSGAFGYFPSFFGRQAFGANSAPLFSAETPKLYGVRIFGRIGRGDRRIG